MSDATDFSANVSSNMQSGGLSAAFEGVVNTLTPTNLVKSAETLIKAVSQESGIATQSLKQAIALVQSPQSVTDFTALLSQGVPFEPAVRHAAEDRGQQLALLIQRDRNQRQHDLNMFDRKAAHEERMLQLASARNYRLQQAGQMVQLSFLGASVKVPKETSHLLLYAFIAFFLVLLLILAWTIFPLLQGVRAGGGHIGDSFDDVARTFQHTTSSIETTTAVAQRVWRQLLHKWLPQTQVATPLASFQAQRPTYFRGLA